MTFKRYLWENKGWHILTAVVLAVLCMVYIAKDGWDWWLFGTVAFCLFLIVGMILGSLIQYEKLQANGDV